MGAAIDVTLDRRNIPELYRGSNRRLIIVDYDGVLVPRQERPGFTIPRKETKQIVQRLSNDPANTFMIMSGRDRSHLDLHWSAFNIILVAEYGAQFRYPHSDWHSLFDIDDSWMDIASDAMQPLPLQYNGSFVERKTHSISWHFMPSGSQTIIEDLPEVVEKLQTLAVSNEFEVYKASDAVELVPRGVDAGSFLARWLGGKTFDLVIALGGGRVEQSLFRILTREALTVSVSPAMTSTAKYWLRSQADVVPFLRSLPGGQ